jgi:hypothetical protein
MRGKLIALGDVLADKLAQRREDTELIFLAVDCLSEDEAKADDAKGRWTDTERKLRALASRLCTKPPPPTGSQWLSLAQAEQLSGINRGTISRAIDAGEIKSNGETGKGKRKIDSADFNRWHLERANRLEQTESEEQVEKLLKNAEGEGKRNKR